MLISAMSDLHLEFGDIVLPGGDVLLLAGDTWLAAPMGDDCITPRARKARECFRRFCAEELSKYQKVFLVNGNHEHYGCHWEETSDIIRKFLVQNAPNAQLLDGQAHEQFGFIFIGTTLWARYGWPDPLQMRKIQTSMSDFLSIRTTDDAGYTRCIIPEDVYRRHIFCRRQVSLLVKKYGQKPKILITHHAPSWLSKKFSAHPHADMDWAYYSNMERTFQPKKKVLLAVHGHTHENSRYRANGTVVCSNQRGYAGYTAEAARFDPSACDITSKDLLESMKIIDEDLKKAKKACQKIKKTKKTSEIAGNLS
jgi:Icc-related predicted phosphoesterase